MTLFPEIFPGPLSCGIIGKALKKNLFSLETIDLKQYSKNGRIDCRPFGGSPGMIIKPEILERCFCENNVDKEVIFFMSPSGFVFDQKMAMDLHQNFSTINILCGRYEGIDQRLFEQFNIVEISIGDFILCGGEIASMTIIESIVRLIPSVLHNENSIQEESFSNGLLEHEHFTKPSIWRDLSVPKILFSGHHKEISKHRFIDSCNKTQKFRNDLWQKYLLNFICCHLVKKIYKKINKK